MQKYLMWLFLFATPLALGDEASRYNALGREESLFILQSQYGPDKDKAAKANAQQVNSAATERAIDEAVAKNTSAPALSSKQPYATYNSDEYLSSETFDAALQPTQKPKKFFITSEAGKLRVEENLDPTMASSGPDVEVKTQRLRAVRSVRSTELTPSEKKFSTCFSDVSPDRTLSLLPLRVFEDKKTQLFAAGSDVVEVLRLKPDVGVRGLRIRSYANKQASPSFWMPSILLLDVNGCVKKQVDHYFERHYAATKDAYEMLEADLSLAGDERFLVFLRADQVTALESNNTPLRFSLFGQISLSWVK